MIGTLADFRDDATLRGNPAPGAAPDADAAAALVRARTYLRAHYRGWEAHTDGEEALYLVAAAELAQPGALRRTYTDGERKVLTGVGAVEWTVVPGASDRAFPVLTDVDGLLRPRKAAVGIMAI